MLESKFFFIDFLETPFFMGFFGFLSEVFSNKAFLLSGGLFFFLTPFWGKLFAPFNFFPKEFFDLFTVAKPPRK